MTVYITDARPFGEVIDVRELVQPWTYPVQRILAGIKSQGDQAIRDAWGASVCGIQYPPASPVDWHRTESFLQRQQGMFAGRGLKPVFIIEKTELLESPSEVLALGMADCDGQSILACSVLRNFLGPQEVYVTFGEWNGFGHAWATLMRDQQAVVLETTKQYEACELAFSGLQEGQAYRPMFRFNDREAFELADISDPVEPLGTEQVRFLALERVGLHKRHLDKVACLCRTPLL